MYIFTAGAQFSHPSSQIYSPVVSEANSSSKSSRCEEGYTEDLEGKGEGWVEEHFFFLLFLDTYFIQFLLKTINV